MKITINRFELIVYYFIYTFMLFLCFVKFFEAQREILESKPHLQLSLKDLAPGWKFLSRDKDISDLEWACWKYFINISWFYMLIQFFISELVRTYCSSLLKHWYILSSILFVIYYMGVRQLAFIIIQPVIFFIIIIVGGKTISIWITSMILLITYNTFKYSYSFWNFLDDGYLVDEKVYLLLVGVAWIELRCISFSLDYVHRQENNTNIKERKGEEPSKGQHFINMLSYVLYLPLLYVGPIIMYEEFERSFNQNNHRKLWPQLKEFTIDMALFLIYTFLLELAFHLMYFNAMHEKIELVRQLPTLALCGGGIWMAFQFYLKYVICYGTTAAFARLDKMEPPPTPRCIGRIHVYSQMWRHFDVGLYKFLVKYIYKPSYNALGRYTSFSTMVYKLIASFWTFTFIFLWHGTVWNIFVWSVLNYCGIVLEYTARALSKTKFYDTFKTNILQTEAMETRFTALLCAPLLGVSAISNFYLFGGKDVGDEFIKLLVWPNPSNALLGLISTYCCSCVSISLLDVKSRTDRKMKE